MLRQRSLRLDLQLDELSLPPAGSFRGAHGWKFQLLQQADEPRVRSQVIVERLSAQIDHEVRPLFKTVLQHVQRAFCLTEPKMDQRKLRRRQVTDSCRVLHLLQDLPSLANSRGAGPVV